MCPRLPVTDLGDGGLSLVECALRLDDPEVRKILGAVPTGLLIGGSWRPATRGTFDVHDPATGARLAAVADAGPDEAMAALG